MKINTSVKYGLIAIGYVAQNGKDGYVMALSISKEYGIPLDYLLKIMLLLTKANILQGKRGPHGGYCLARPSKEITLYDIIEAIDGPLVQIEKISKYTKTSPFAVKMVKVCKDAVKAEKTILQKAKLSQMIK